MARIRTIKPDFWEDEKIGILSHGARLLFLGILNFGDDEGLVRWNPMYLGASIFPYDEIKPETIEKWMNDLVENEIIYVYQTGKIRQKVGMIVNFHKHQRIDKPQPSKFNAPNWSDIRFKKIIAIRDKWTCKICGELIPENARTDVCNSMALSIDHIKPRVKGGSDYPSNLQAVHLKCNLQKGCKYSENDSENDSENNSTTEKEEERERESNSNGKGSEKEDYSNSNELLSGTKATHPARIDYQNIVSLFNSTTKGTFGMLKYPLSRARMDLIQSRIREHGMDTFKEVITKASKSNFLKGDNKRSWKATFDWIIKPSNFDKIITGNYDNRVTGASMEEDDFINNLINK